MTFEPTPAQVQWIGFFVVLTAALTFAERAWQFVNKIISDCQRRRRIQDKCKERQAAKAIRRMAVKRPAMPKPAIGTERFPSTERPQAEKSRSKGALTLSAKRNEAHKIAMS